MCTDHLDLSMSQNPRKRRSQLPSPREVPRELSPVPATDSETSTGFSKEVKRYNGVSGMNSEPSDVQRARYYGSKDEVIESASDSERTSNLQDAVDLSEDSVASNKDFGKAIEKEKNAENLAAQKTKESSGEDDGKKSEGEDSRRKNIPTNSSRIVGEGGGEVLNSDVSTSSVHDQRQVKRHDEAKLKGTEVEGRAETATPSRDEHLQKIQNGFQVPSNSGTEEEEDTMRVRESETGELSSLGSTGGDQSKPRDGGEEKSKPGLSPLTHPSDEGSNFGPDIPDLSAEAEARGDDSISSGSLTVSSLGARPTTVGRESMGNKQTSGRSRSRSASSQNGKSSDDNNYAVAIHPADKEGGGNKKGTGDYTYFHFSESDVIPCASPLDGGMRARDVFSGDLSASDGDQKPEMYADFPGRGAELTEDEQEEIQPYATYSSFKSDDSVDKSHTMEEASTLEFRKSFAGAYSSERDETPEISVSEEPIYATVNKTRALATESVKNKVESLNVDSVSEEEPSEGILSDQEGTGSKSEGFAMSASDSEGRTTSGSDRRFYSSDDSEVVVLPIYGRTRRNVASKKYTEVVKELSTVLEKRAQATRTQSMREDRADAAAELGVKKSDDTTGAGISKSSEHVNNVFVNKSLLSMLERHLVSKNESDKLIKPGVGGGGNSAGSGGSGSEGRGVNSENVVRVLKKRQAVSAKSEAQVSGSDSNAESVQSSVTDSEDNPRGMRPNSEPRNTHTPVEQRQSPALHIRPGSTKLVHVDRNSAVKSPVDTYGKRVSAKLIYNHSALLSPPKPESPVSSYDAELVSSAAGSSNYYSSSGEDVLETIHSEGKASGPGENESFTEESTSFRSEIKEQSNQPRQHHHYHRSRGFREEKTVQATRPPTEHSLSWARGADFKSVQEQSKFISVSSHHAPEIPTSTKVTGREKSASPLKHHSSMHALGRSASQRRDGARKLNRSMDSSHVTTIHITGRGLKRQEKITYSEPDLVHALNQTRSSGGFDGGGGGRASITVSPRRWGRDPNHPRASSLHDTSRSRHPFKDEGRGNVSASNYSLNASMSYDMSLGNETLDDSVQFHNSFGPNNYSFDQSMYRSLLDGGELLTAGYQMVRVNVGSGDSAEGVEIPLAQIPASSSIQDARSLGNDTYFISTGDGSTPLPVTVVRSRSSSFTAFGGGGSNSGGSSRSSRRPSPNRKSPTRQASMRTVVQTRQSPSRLSLHGSQSPSPMSPTQFSSTIYNHHHQHQPDQHSHRPGEAGDSHRGVVTRTVSLRSGPASGSVQAKLSRSQTFDRGRQRDTSNDINTLYRVSSSRQQVHQSLYSKKQQQQQQHSPRYYDGYSSEGNLSRSSFHGGVNYSNFTTGNGNRYQRLVQDDQVSDVSEASEASHLYVVLPTEGPRPIRVAPDHRPIRVTPELPTEKETQQHWQQRRLPPDGGSDLNIHRV